MNYMVPIYSNLPAIQTNMQDTLSAQIAAQASQYQFPICNSVYFNLDNVYGLVTNNLANEYNHDSNLNCLAQQMAPTINQVLGFYMNYNGTLVLNSIHECLADETSIAQFCNSTANVERRLQTNDPSPNNQMIWNELWLIKLLGYLFSTINTLLPEFTDRFIKPRVTGNRVLKAIPPLFQILKGEMLRRILFDQPQLFYADNQGTLQTYIKKRFQEIDLVVPYNQYTMKSRNPLSKIEDLNQCLKYCDYILNVLHKITDGKISAFNNLCKLSAKILLGRKILANEFKIKPALTVITTNNFTIIQQFFSAVCDVATATVRRKRGQQCLYIDIIQNFNDKISLSEGHYKMVSNLEPIRNTNILSHRSNAELNNPDNIGKIIEADIKGNLVNITEKKLPDGQLNTLRNLITGNQIEKNNHYLGRQSFNSNALFIQLEYPESGYSNILSAQKIPFEVLELGIHTNPYCGIFENGEGFTHDEITWFWTFTAIKGLDLLRNEPHEGTQKIDPFAEFMNISVEVADYSEDNKNQKHKNTIPFKTLGKMYSKFLEITQPHQPPKEIDVGQKFLTDHGYGMFKCKSIKNAPTYHDLKEKGYLDDETADKNSPYMHILGLSIKPKNLLIQEYNKINHKHNEEKNLNFVEFIDYLISETEIINATSKSIPPIDVLP